MGNRRFKLSDMIPNAWFYKLRDMGRSRKRNNGSHLMKNNKVASPTTSQCSHYFSNEPNISGKYYNSPIYTKHTNIIFSDSPRRSLSKRRAKRKTIYKPSPTIVSSPVLESWSKPYHAKSHQECDDVSSIESSSESNFQECVSSESECDKNVVFPELLNGQSSECSCRVSSSTNDIIIDMNNESFTGKTENLDGFDPISQLGLARILTKPVKFDDKLIEANELRNSSKLAKLDKIHDHHSLPVKTGKDEKIRTQRERKTSPIARKSSANSTGIKLSIKSPKLASRKVQAIAYARRSSVSSNACKASENASFPEGFAVVKSSINPQKDFKESMVEMIKENNIKASKDLENLLACYLSLNSSEYHDLIVKAFEQIWYDMAQLRL